MSFLLDDKKIVAASKEYAYQLQYYIQNDYRVIIYTSAIPKDDHDGRYRFKLIFSENSETGEKTCECFKIIIEKEDKEVAVWRKELDKSLNLAELSLQKFCQILEVWNTFGTYNLTSADSPIPLIEEEWLKMFEDGRKQDYTLQLMDQFEGRKNVVIMCPFGTEKLPDQWHAIKTHWYSPYIGISYEKFLQMSAARLILHIGTMTPENIVDFIILWKARIIRENFEWVVFNLKNSKFNVKMLWSLLNNDPDTCEPIPIEQYSNLDKRARLYYYKKQLRFFVDDFSKPQATEDNTWKFYFKNFFCLPARNNRVSNETSC